MGSFRFALSKIGVFCQTGTIEIVLQVIHDYAE